PSAPLPASPPAPDGGPLVGPSPPAPPAPPAPPLPALLPVTVAPLRLKEPPASTRIPPPPAPLPPGPPSPPGPPGVPAVVLSVPAVPAVPAVPSGACPALTVTLEAVSVPADPISP